jgi:YkoP-like protein
MNRLQQWRLVGSAVGGERHFWLEQLLFGLDGVLRRWQSVIEYTHDPTCILRIKFGRLDQDFALSDGTVGHAGERFIDLHLWNEQVPAMPKEGASIAWARQMSLRFQHSLRQLARYLASRADLDDISLVRCTMMFASGERDDQMVRMIGRYGFELVPSATTVTMAERARRLGENIFISLIVLARNRGALRRDTLRRGRTRVFMSRKVLEQRYGGGAGRIDP